MFDDRSLIFVGFDPKRRAYISTVVFGGPVAGRHPIRIAIPLAPIVKAITQLMVKRQMKREGIQRNQVGIFGWIKKTINKVAKKAHKIAKSIGLVKIIKKATRIVKKVAKTAKDVFKHPVFETAVTSIASIVPGGAAIVQGAYKAAKGAIQVVERATQGDPRALRTIGKYAMPGNEKAMRMIQAAAQSRRGRPAPRVRRRAVPRNPWAGMASYPFFGQQPAQPSPWPSYGQWF